MENKTVAEIITELKQSNLVDLMSPSVLANSLLILSAHIFQAGSNITSAEIAYSEKWKELRAKTESDKQADNAVKAESEYKTLQEAKYAEKALIETIRSLKKVLQVKADEARNQY